MDLLPTPDDSAIPTGDTPYLAGDERWACDHFLTYAGPDFRSTIENLKALTDKELNGVFQTWLFFGLVAEFLGLNEQEDGKHFIKPSAAQSELDDLYKECIIVKEDGKEYVTGAKIVALLPRIRTRIVVAWILDRFQQRLMYLDRCVCYAYEVWDTRYHDVAKRLNDNIKWSLAALGELFTTFMKHLRQELQPSLELKAPFYAWFHEYLVVGGRLEGQLLAHGWCPSEVEKVRAQSLSLNAMHYTSRLRKAEPWMDHSRCHKYRCIAFQIRLDEYHPAHIKPCRGCDPLHVDLDGVNTILEKTHSFPVLTGKTVWNEVEKRDEMQVEAFEPGIPYVAISHVWADGLGNPFANALPRCQVERLMNFVANLQKTVDPGWKEGGQPPYRLWVDPLCCPVKSKGKVIALGRIADVYRNATHVLVLDNSFTSFPSEMADPAQLLFRATICSAWMRRLWTYQEGALARSLYYQFADCAITSGVLLPKVFDASSKDLRYWLLAAQLCIEADLFKEFSPHKESRRPGENILKYLQRALYFRSVSVPRDEPLCIATILGLDIRRVADENGRNATQKRMAIVWEMIARRMGGIPPNVMFRVDNPLDIVGFRWAPRSLLAADVQQSTVDTEDPYAERAFFESTVGLSSRFERFSYGPDTKLAQLVSQGHRKGLRGSYPGFRVFARPYLGMDTAPEQYRLHPWDGLLNNSPELLLRLKEEETDRWFLVWSLEHKWDDRILTKLPSGAPVCKRLHNGHCAIIRESAETFRDTVGEELPSEACLMVTIEQEDDIEFIVRRQFRVALQEATKEDIVLAETMTELAEELASEQVTANFLAARDQVESDEYTLAKVELKERMKELVAEALESRPDFAKAAKVKYGRHNQKHVWETMAMENSHHIILKRTPDDQLWLVD